MVTALHAIDFIGNSFTHLFFVKLMGWHGHIVLRRHRPVNCMVSLKVINVHTKGGRGGRWFQSNHLNDHTILKKGKGKRDVDSSLVPRLNPSIQHPKNDPSVIMVWKVVIWKNNPSSVKGGNLKVVLTPKVNLIIPPILTGANYFLNQKFFIIRLLSPPITMLCRTLL